MRRLCSTLVALAIGAASAITVPVRASAPAWTAAWATSLHGSRDFGMDPWARAALPLQTVADQTLRMVARVRAPGRTVRVVLSNRDGDKPVTFARATVARRVAGAAVDPTSMRQLLFAGAAAITLPPGAEVVSDPVALTVDAGVDVAVSVHVRGTTSLPAWHRFANVTSYLSSAGSGDATGDATGGPFDWPVTSWFWLARVDVAGGAPTPVVVALGDSITDGFPLVPDAQQAWPAALASRAAAAGRRLSVLNAGIAGNRVVGPPCGQCGRRALDRLDRDVLAMPGVRTLIVAEGTNDLAGGVDPFELVKGLADIARWARAHGLRVIGTTIPPRGGSMGWTAELERRRWDVNHWIVHGGVFDAVVDFDAALRNPLAHEQMRSEYDSGDQLHPNALGLDAMAAAIPLASVVG
jgi:lysophospholipase L1-like esterase